MTLPDLFQQWQQWAQTDPLLAHGSVGAAAAIPGMWLIWRKQRHRQQMIADSHGSSQWAEKSHIRQAGFFAPEGIVLGRYGKRLLMDNGEGHVIQIGLTGIGKDQNTNLPTTAFCQGSMLITDPKATDVYPLGENYGICGWLRAQLGPVYRFAPAQEGSCCINVLDAVAWGKITEFDDVSFITRSMLMPAHNEKWRSDEDKFWGGYGLQMLRAATLYVGNFPLPGEEGKKPYASFPRVLRVMQDRAQCLAAMQRCQHPLIAPVAYDIAQMAQESERQFRGIWSTALSALDIYQSPLIARHTSKSDFPLTDLQAADTPITVYLSADSSSQLAHLSGIFRPIIEQTIAQLKSKRLPRRRPLLCVLNEFPTFGYMPSIEKDIADVRAQQIRFLISVQTPGQLFDTYGRHTPIWGNTWTKIFHGSDDDDFAKRLSENLLGRETIEYESTHHTRSGGKLSSGRTVQRMGKPLLDTAELMGLPPDQVIIRSRACRYPILATKVRYWKDREFQRRAA